MARFINKKDLMEKENINEVIERFVTYTQRFDNTAPNEHWYVGITTRDPDIRKNEHENKKNIICEHFKALHKTDKQMARIIEKKLEVQGFAICEEDLQVEAKEDQSQLTYIYVFHARHK